MPSAVPTLSKCALAALFLCAAVPGASGADLSRYRGFSFGAKVAAVTGETGASASGVKEIHRRPALIQELEWRPQPAGLSTQREAASDVLFRFVDGRLYRVEVRYDRYEIEGLTSDDIVEAVSAIYGPATRVTKAGQSARTSYDYTDEVAAQWEDAQYRFDLVRSPSAGSFRLIGVSKELDAAATAATAESRRLDDLEAPQRDAARAASEQSAAAAKLEKARTVNKPRFRP